MMKFASLIFTLSLSTFTTACGPDPVVDHAPDAPPASIPIDPAGRYAIHTTWTLTPPHGVQTVLAQFTAATDGADDPSRFLVDKAIDCLDDGWTKEFARVLAPIVAVYVNDRIDEIAPKFTAGVQALARGLDQVARRVGTDEMLVIANDGRAQRTITAARFDHATIALAPIAIETSATLEGDRLTIASHALALPHGKMIRAGFEQSVIPNVVPGAKTLPAALIALVDCDKLGALVAEKVGLGSPSLYAQACRIGVTAAAAEIDDRLAMLDVVPLELAVTGVARGLDRDGNHTMDAIEAGAWIGGSSTAIFAGSVP